MLGDREELGCPGLTAKETNWLLPESEIPTHCEVQIRYNTRPVPGTVELLPERRLRVVFDEPQYGVAPGQAVVCYNGDRTLGGGWIE